MKVLVIGGGAREHAMAKGLHKAGAELFATMGNRNPGIAGLCSDFKIVKETEIQQVKEFAVSKGVEMAVIGPEAPLVEGIVDVLEDAGVSCVGPSKDAARLEGSKEFMRDLMKKHEIPGRIEYEVFDDIGSSEQFLRAHSGQDFVIKPIGLCGGKGAKIMGEHFHSIEETMEYVKDIIRNKLGGSSRLIIEERITGEEFTLQAFVDGKHIVPMPLVQDHKRAYEGDKGPNTGGMGSYSQADHMLPFINKKEYQEALDIMQKVVDAMASEGCPYKGFLYGQFMLTAKGPKIIEFNARFGDPEAMNVLSLLDSDLLEICKGIVKGNMGQAVFRNQATVCKYIVPKGYGVKSLSDQPIDFKEEDIKMEGAELFYASVNEKDGRVFTTTSRSLGVVGFGGEIWEAEQVAERALAHVKGEVFMRHDIGKKEQIEKKIQHMKELRG